MCTQGNRNPSGLCSNRRVTARPQKPQADQIKGPIQRTRRGSGGDVRDGCGGQCGQLDAQPKYVFSHNSGVKRYPLQHRSNLPTRRGDVVSQVQNLQLPVLIPAFKLYSWIHTAVIRRRLRLPPIFREARARRPGGKRPVPDRPPLIIA